MNKNIYQDQHSYSAKQLQKKKQSFSVKSVFMPRYQVSRS